MKWKGRVFKLLVSLFILFLFIIASSNMYLSKMKYVKLPDDNESLGIKKEEPYKEQQSEDKAPGTDDLKIKVEDADNKDTLDGQIMNIVLLGSDRRYKGEASHTDAIIILTIDGVHKKLKVSSVMRDTYVQVHGHGKTKINHAYAYGGPQLIIRALNENFGLDIRDFVFVDFNGFEKAIDSVGGVEVEVKKCELGETNYRIKEMAGIRRARPSYLRQAGKQVLNGQQALAYSRIRKVGNGDYERTDRQRRVLEALFKKVKEVGAIKYPFIVANILPFTETSLSKTDILKLGTYILNADVRSIEQRRFPGDECSRGKMIDKVWYLVTDIKATKKQLHQFIYEDKSTI